MVGDIETLREGDDTWRNRVAGGLGVVADSYPTAEAAIEAGLHLARVLGVEHHVLESSEAMDASVAEILTF